MKYLVTGTTGQLGYDVVRELEKRGYNNIFKASLENMDLTNEQQVKEVIKHEYPDVVIHCAAYTNVDGAEEDKDNCMLINATATKWIAEICKEIDSKLIYISTDYVFDGSKDGIYEPSDKKHPLNIYGKSKSEGEEYALLNSKTFVVRTSWVYGINGKSFVKTMLRLASTKTEISVVNDQIGSPTYTKDLAKLLVDMSLTDKYGVYHATNEGFCSWYEFAKKIFELTNTNILLNSIPTDEYPQKAKRPKNSRLSKECLVKNGFEKLSNWEIAIQEYLVELQNSDNE